MEQDTKARAHTAVLQTLLHLTESLGAQQVHQAIDLTLLLIIVEELFGCKLFGEDEVVGRGSPSRRKIDVELLKYSFNGTFSDLETIGFGHTIDSGILHQSQLDQIASTFVDTIADVEGFIRLIEDVLIIRGIDDWNAMQYKARGSNQKHHKFAHSERE